jgi:quercetin dioxygenase-like cupin family protein
VVKQMQSANVNAGERVKTNFGESKFLIQNEKGQGANVMIRYWGPETDIPIHAHPYDEMWYVLEGEVEFGETTYVQGDVLYIPSGVRYGPTRAPKGVTLLRYAQDAGG